LPKLGQWATGAVALQLRREKFASKRAPVDRGRDSSAARSIQRMNVHQADRCREATAPVSFENMLRGCAQHSRDRPQRISRRRAPSFSLSQEQARARLCSTAPVKIALFALQVWNETGTRFAPNVFLSPPRQTRSDSPPRSRNRSSGRL